jgi:hypothetical protein
MTEQDLLELGKDPEKLLAKVEEFIVSLKDLSVEYKLGLENRNVDIAMLCSGFTTGTMAVGFNSDTTRLLKTVVASAYLLGRKDESEAKIEIAQMFEPIKVTVGANPWPTVED